jgi:hypothetical protein
VTGKGLNIDTGKNIVADMLEEIEVNNTEGTKPKNEYRNTPAFLRHKNNDLFFSQPDIQ